MDPLTHALTGAAVATLVGGERVGRRALAIGAAAALMPDLDVLVRSASDPLLAIEHHRGFTHALLFAPVGGAAAAILCGGRTRAAWLAAVAAWLSHALLDSATTYGTQLFWPFSRLRVSLDVISIIDPLFTLIVLAAAMAAFRGRRRGTAIAIACACLWLALGSVQRERASAAQRRLAAARGERIERGAVFPTIGNTLVWRSLYESGGALRMDRIRVPWLGAATVAEGPRLPSVTRPPDERARRDFERLAWFSDRWLAADPTDPSMLGDARYSLHADRYRPVWGVRFEPTRWVDRSRERRVRVGDVWRELAGRDPDFRPLP